LSAGTTGEYKYSYCYYRSEELPAQSLNPSPALTQQHRQLLFNPNDMIEPRMVSVFLCANGTVSQPTDWSQRVNFYVTVVNQWDEKHNRMGALTSHTFTASDRGAYGKVQALARTVLNDIKSTTPSMGYVVNDTLIIQCDMTNLPSAAAAPAAAAAPQRETRIVDADTAAAAAIAAACPGALPDIAAALPAVAAAIAAAANPGAVSGAAPRVAVPAGLYPTGNGGLLYLPLGALANY